MTNKDGYEISYENHEYTAFLDNILQFSKTFENFNMDIDNILEWPYFLYNDLIIKKVEMLKNEKQKQDPNNKVKI